MNQTKSNIIFKIILLVYSIFFASLIIYLNQPISEAYITYSYVRMDLIDNFMSIIREGGMPQYLSAPEHSWGFTFYMPYLGVLLGMDARELVFSIHMLFSWSLLVIFPFEVWYAIKNKLMAFLAPILLHLFCGNILYGYKIDTLWAAGWVIAITFPLLYKLYKEENYKKILLLSIIIGLICSIGNIMRNHNGLYSAFVFAIIIVFKIFQKRKVGIQRFIREIIFSVGVIIGFVFCYKLFDETIPLIAGIITDRDRLTNVNMVWHAIMAGLGLYPNEYGLECSDNVIISYIQNKYPGVGKYTNEYLDACRACFFEFLKSDPKFVIGTWWRSFCRAMQGIYQYQFTYLKESDFYYYSVKTNVHNILVPSLLATGTYVAVIFVKLKKKFKTYFSQCINCIFWCICIIISGTAQGVLLMPSIRYYMPSMAGVGFLFVVISLATVYEIQSLFNNRTSLSKIKQ